MNDTPRHHAWRGLAPCSALVLATVAALVLALSVAGRSRAWQRWVFGRALETPSLFWPSSGLPTDVVENRPARTPYVVPIGGSSTSTAFQQVPEELQGRITRTPQVSFSFINQVPLVRVLCQRWELAGRAPGSVFVFGIVVLPTGSSDISYMSYYDRLMKQRFTEGGLYRLTSDRILRPVCPAFLRPLWIETGLRARRFAQLARGRLTAGPQEAGESMALEFAPRAGRTFVPPPSNTIARILGDDPEPSAPERLALRTCVQLAQAARARPVLLHLPLPAHVRNLEAVQRTRAYCRDLAAMTGAEYWDYTDLVPESGFLDPIGHHNDEGRQLIVRVVHQRIAALLREPAPAPETRP